MAGTYPKCVVNSMAANESAAQFTGFIKSKIISAIELLFSTLSQVAIGLNEGYR